jgi:hypothetical protein
VDEFQVSNPKPHLNLLLNGAGTNTNVFVVVDVNDDVEAKIAAQSIFRARSLTLTATSDVRRKPSTVIGLRYTVSVVTFTSAFTF